MLVFYIYYLFSQPLPCKGFLPQFSDEKTESQRGLRITVNSY